MSHCFRTVIFTSVLVNSDQRTIPSQVYKLTDLSIDWLSILVKCMFVIPKWVCKLTDSSPCNACQPNKGRESGIDRSTDPNTFPVPQMQLER